MLARNIGMYSLLFCVFFMIIAISIDLPLSKAVLKLCKGNKKVGRIIVPLIIGLLAYVLVKLTGSQIVNFLDILFCTKFRRIDYSIFTSYIL